MYFIKFLTEKEKYIYGFWISSYKSFFYILWDVAGCTSQSCMISVIFCSFTSILMINELYHSNSKTWQAFSQRNGRHIYKEMFVHCHLHWLFGNNEFAIGISFRTWVKLILLSFSMPSTLHYILQPKNHRTQAILDVLTYLEKYLVHFSGASRINTECLTSYFWSRKSLGTNNKVNKKKYLGSLEVYFIK